MLLTRWCSILVGTIVYVPYARADSASNWFVNSLNNHNQFTNEQMTWLMIGVLAVINIIILIILLTVAIQHRQHPAPQGVSGLIGAQGRALGDINGAGQAMISGEIWTVFAQKMIVANKPITVVAAYGLQLEVEEIINGTSRPCMF